MKIQIIFFLTIVLGFLSACDDNGWEHFNGDFNYVYFVNEKSSVYENSTKTLSVVVGASGISGENLTVGYEILVSDSTAGYRTAKEGVDFRILNTTRQLSFAQGVGYDTISIQTIDNELKDGHRAFHILLKENDRNYATGMNGRGSVAEIVILDDESSSKWEGAWEVSGKTVWYYSSTNQLKATSDTASNITQAFTPYEVLIVAHPTEANVLLVKNFMGQEALQLSLLVDEDDDRLSLKAGVIGRINDFDIHFGGFDREGEDTGNQAISVDVVDDNTLRVVRFMSYYETTTGEIVYTGPEATILKSTWKRIN